MKKYKDIVDGDIVYAEQVTEVCNHGELRDLPVGLWKLWNIGMKPLNWAPADHVFQKEFSLVEDEKPKKKKEELPE